MKGVGKLNARQSRFVAEYLIDGNATNAAMRAGYSSKTAQEQGSRLLSNVMVQRELNAMQAEVAGRLNLSAEAVLVGVMASILEAREAQQFSAAMRGYELLGKHLKMWTDKVEATGKDGAPVEMTIKRVVCDL